MTFIKCQKPDREGGLLPLSLDLKSAADTRCRLPISDRGERCPRLRAGF